MSSYAYTYYLDGNQQRKTDHTGLTTSYAYDGAGRLVSETESGGLSLAYQYDKSGNRTQMAASGTDNYVVAYAYDANNRLTLETKTGAAVTEATRYCYDNKGNLYSKTREAVSPGLGNGEIYLTSSLALAELYRYNGWNQLVSASVGETTTAYTYYANGLRASKSDVASEARYILDGGDVVVETVGGAAAAKYVRGIGLLYSESSGTARWYLYNAHGDVAQLADSTGAVVKDYAYDAFGVEKDPDSGDTNPFRYCGEQYDAETGTYYLRARSYDPGTGRFTSEDAHWNTGNMIYGDNPAKWNEREADPRDPQWLNAYTYVPDVTAIMQSGNLYVYCINNPVVFTDPSGHLIETKIVTGWDAFWKILVMASAIGVSVVGVIGMVAHVISLHIWSSPSSAKCPEPVSTKHSNKTETCEVGIIVSLVIIYAASFFANLLMLIFSLSLSRMKREKDRNAFTRRLRTIAFLIPANIVIAAACVAADIILNELEIKMLSLFLAFFAYISVFIAPVACRLWLEKKKLIEKDNQSHADYCENNSSEKREDIT